MGYPIHLQPWVKKHTSFRIYIKDTIPNNNNIYSKKDRKFATGTSIIHGFPNQHNFISSDINGDGLSDIVIAQTSLEIYGNKLLNLKYYIATDIDSVFNTILRLPQSEYSRIEKPNIYW